MLYKGGIGMGEGTDEFYSWLDQEVLVTKGGERVRAGGDFPGPPRKGLFKPRPGLKS